MGTFDSISEVAFLMRSRPKCLVAWARPACRNGSHSSGSSWNLCTAPAGGQCLAHLALHAGAVPERRYRYTGLMEIRQSRHHRSSQEDPRSGELLGCSQRIVANDGELALGSTLANKAVIALPPGHSVGIGNAHPTVGPVVDGQLPSFGVGVSAE